MTGFTVVYDACVLYPAFVRSYLMWLAMEQKYRARWSHEIQDEWTRHLIAQNPERAASITSAREAMDRSVNDCIVEGYQALTPSLDLPDPNDNHVLAVAITCGASVIVTFNLKHFPAACLSKYEIEAQSPDTFIVRLADVELQSVLNAAKNHRAELKRYPYTVDQYIERVAVQMPRAAELFAGYADAI